MHCWLEETLLLATKRESEVPVQFRPERRVQLGPETRPFAKQQPVAFASAFPPRRAEPLPLLPAFAGFWRVAPPSLSYALPPARVIPHPLPTVSEPEEVRDSQPVLVKGQRQQGQLEILEVEEREPSSTRI